MVEGISRKFTLITLSVFLVISLLMPGVIGAQQSNPRPASTSERSVVDRYCIACHNERLKTAGLMLDKIDLGQVHENGPVLEKVLTKVRTGAMPPAGAARPSNDAYASLIHYLETELDNS